MVHSHKHVCLLLMSNGLDRILLFVVITGFHIGNVYDFCLSVIPCRSEKHICFIQVRSLVHTDSHVRKVFT